MTIKAKISVAALVLAAFVIGGFALNAYKAEALKGAGFFFHKFGVNKEDWVAKKEEWKEMTPEEYKAKMEELKAQKGEWKAEWKGDMKKSGFGHPFCLFKKFGDEINRDIVTLENGIQITITSGDPDIVQKLHDLVEKFNK